MVSHPSEWQRWKLLTARFLVYYWRQPVGAAGALGSRAHPPRRAQSVYGLRVLEYLIIGFLLGTLWLRLSHDTAKILEISAAVFFNIWCNLFVVITSTIAWVEDRRQVRHLLLPLSGAVALMRCADGLASQTRADYLSGAYGTVTHVLAVRTRSCAARAPKSGADSARPMQQFVAALPYTLTAALVYQSVFHVRQRRAL
jgi:hypothetical protein